MAHALTRNRTYALLDGGSGAYKNIRTYKRSDHVKRMDGDEEWILPPPQPNGCIQRDDPTQTPQCYHGWQVPNSTTVREFSAACWCVMLAVVMLARDVGGGDVGA